MMGKLVWGNVCQEAGACLVPARCLLMSNVESPRGWREATPQGRSRPKLGGLVAEFAAHSVQCGLGIMQTRL